MKVIFGGGKKKKRAREKEKNGQSGRAVVRSPHKLPPLGRKVIKH